MSTKRVDGQRIVDLLISVGLEWKGIISVSVGPGPIMTVRRAVLTADGRKQLDPTVLNELLADEIHFGIDWPEV